MAQTREMSHTEDGQTVTTTEVTTPTGEKVKTFFSYVFSGLGGLGIALQNTMAVGQLINTISNGTLALTAAGQAIMNGVAIAVGGLCSGIMNFLINVPLLKGFFDRLSNLRFGSKLKGWEKLSTWQKFTYWAGIAIFITSGIMLGLTAFAFGPIGVLAAIGIAAGILVALISTVQELETWLERFDETEEDKKKAEEEAAETKDFTPEQLEEYKKKKAAKLAEEEEAEAKLTLKQRFIRWKDSITKEKIIGAILTIGNVVALSLLMAMGVAAFLSGVGVPALPALIAGLGIAFTAGAFTEYYFYSKFLSDFCTKFKAKWQAFKESKYWGLGLACVTTNAVVTGVLTYVGITMIAGLILAAGVAAPPLGIVIAVAALAAIFAATASFLLGLDFWSKNMKKEEVPVAADTAENKNELSDEPESTISTDCSLNQVFANAETKPKVDPDAIPLMTGDDLDLSRKNMEKLAAEQKAAADDKKGTLASVFKNDGTFSKADPNIIPQLPSAGVLSFFEPKSTTTSPINQQAGQSLGLAN